MRSLHSFIGLFVIAVTGCTIVVPDIGLRSVRDVDASDSRTGKAIECTGYAACWNIAQQVCPNGYDVLQQPRQNKDGTLTMLVRCQ